MTKNKVLNVFFLFFWGLADATAFFLCCTPNLKKAKKKQKNKKKHVCSRTAL
jgi:hypothetical protein